MFRTMLSNKGLGLHCLEEAINRATHILNIAVIRPSTIQTP